MQEHSHSMQVQQGLYLYLKLNEIENLSNGYQMLNTLMRSMNQFSSQPLKQKEPYEKILSLLNTLITPLKPLIVEQQSFWMGNLSKVQQLEIQVYIRLCAIKIEQRYQSVSGFDLLPSKPKKGRSKEEEIIRLFNQLKIQQGEYDISGSFKKMVDTLPELESEGFRASLGKIIQHFDLNVKFEERECDVARHPENVNELKGTQNVLPEKDGVERKKSKERKQRTHPEKGVSNASQPMTQTQPVPTTPRNRSKNAYLQIVQTKPTTQRTLYHSHSKNYIFKKKP